MHIRVLIAGGIGDNIINILCAFFYLKNISINRYILVFSENMKFKIDIILKIIKKYAYINNNEIITESLTSEEYKELLNNFLIDQDSSTFGPKTLFYKDKLYICFWLGLSNNIAELAALSKSWPNLNATYNNLPNSPEFEKIFNVKAKFPKESKIFLNLVANSIEYDATKVLRKSINYLTNNFEKIESISLLVPNDERDDLDKKLSLSDKIKYTIETLKNSGININLVTGDFNLVYKEIKNCDLIMGARSGLIELAYLLKKPTMIFYPEHHNYLFYKLNTNEPIIENDQDFIITCNYL